ncbi:universal stress protein [Vallitalea sp.]|jgi:K+-sensing histidine kinase KdpD|uniref:universal stress protein n=1 Tax=Vallitalea sp. TaxID=1882829 RepID=UPI0025DD29C1|nr:universal stress protein [Vallitalea sp.]MCT4687735.1 universal stress protein [Vallitalea sp.]
MSQDAEKVLVCITIQKNSKRLIRKGAEIANEINGELHILHVEKGMSIFKNEESIKLLEELFEYGKQLGGEVHFLSGKDVPSKIVDFIKSMQITRLVLGETMRSKLHRLLTKDIENNVLSQTKEVELLILERNNNDNKKFLKDKKLFSN